MAQDMTIHETDVAVVGSGPGGATVARQLARAGQRVMLLEMGRDYRREIYYGSHLGALIYGDQHSLLFSEEGLNIIRPIMTGGATNMFCGCSAVPPGWLKERYGVDLGDYAQETIGELRIAPLPDDLQGSASRRVMEAGQDLGHDWQPMPKFMAPSRACRFDCGAKWTANEYMDEAVAAGCTLLTRARVDEIIIEDGQVGGVRGKLRGHQPFEVRAKVVVVSAGGIGTPLILQKSGFAEAGRGMAMDPTVMVYGVSKGPGTAFEPPMTVGYSDHEHGYMLSTLIDPWFLFPIMATLKGPRYLLTWRNYHRTVGVMIKVTDEVSGIVSVEGRISKPMTARDRERLHHATVVSRQILVKAGCDPDSIYVSRMRGTHPSATVRLGEMVDGDLQTSVRNLYVCDASVFPEALGLPTVLTIISFAKRLSDHLLQGVPRRETAPATASVSAAAN